MRPTSLRVTISVMYPASAWPRGIEAASPDRLDVAQVYKVLGAQASHARVLGDGLVDHVLQAGEGRDEPRLWRLDVVLVSRLDLLGIVQVEPLPQTCPRPLRLGGHGMHADHQPLQEPFD